MPSNSHFKEFLELMDLVKAAEDVRFFRFRRGDWEIEIRKDDLTTPSVEPRPVDGDVKSKRQEPIGQSQPLPQSVPSAAIDVRSDEVAVNEVLVRAPMVGVFYSAPTPGAPTFVSEGASVSSETTLCIIEVMKLMNSISAGVAGTVDKIFVENGQPVEFNQPLFLIRKAGT